MLNIGIEHLGSIFLQSRVYRDPISNFRRSLEFLSHKKHNHK